MINGAEPVRAATLRSFTTHFADSGLRPEALSPCYGMAETCIFGSVDAIRPPTIIRVETASLSADASVVVLDGISEGGDCITSELVGCGHTACWNRFLFTRHTACQTSLSPWSKCLARGAVLFSPELPGPSCP